MDGRQSDKYNGYEHKEWKTLLERFTNISDFVYELYINYNTQINMFT